MSWLGYGSHALLVLVAALAVDLTLGEYPRTLHPVVWMGRVIRTCERGAPRAGLPLAQLGFGALMAVGIPAAFAAFSAALIALMRHSPLATFVVEVYFLKASFALSALGRSAREVDNALRGGDIDGARTGLRSLCSRDPSVLGERELVAGAVESVAENASDSFVAPVLFFAVFGVPGAIAYRAINTLDAIVGYRGRYEYLGKASAHLDDLANLVPARLTAALLLLAGAILGKDAARGLATWRRDACRTESPNAGRPMSAMAGLLRVQLAKPGHYELGEEVESLAPGKIAEAWRVVALAGALHVMLVAAWFGGRHVF